MSIRAIAWNDDALKGFGAEQLWSRAASEHDPCHPRPGVRRATQARTARSLRHESGFTQAEMATLQPVGKRGIRANRTPLGAGRVNVCEGLSRQWLVGRDNHTTMTGGHR